jgi:hypothetical protein
VGASLETRIGFLGAGALLAVAVALLRASSDPVRASSVGPVAFWVADRDGCAVYGLDEDLVLSRRVRVGWPIAVVARPDGGAWVLRSPSGSPAGPARLVRLDPDATIRSETDILGNASLDALADGTAIVLEGSESVSSCDETGRVAIVFRGRALTCIAGSKDSIAVGDAHGTLVRVSLDPSGVVLARVDLRERIADLAADIDSGRFWAITTSEGATIHRLDDELAVEWSTGAGSVGTRLASSGDRDRIWIVDGSQSVIRRLGEHGVIDLETERLPIAGVMGAAPATRGGLAAVGAGGVLLMDSAGNARPCQGGFTHLVDIDRVP